MSADPANPEAGLDPQQAQLVRKLRRLMLFSTVLMVGGIFAIFAVIYYRLQTAPDRSPSTVVTSPSATPVTPNLNPAALPRVISTTIGEGRIVITLEQGNRIQIRVFDLQTLEHLKSVEFNR